MKLKDIKISRQINTLLWAVLLMVIILTASALVSMEGIWSSTEDMYNHPLAVRRAVGDLEADVLTMQTKMLQLVNNQNQATDANTIKEMDTLEAEAYRKIDSLYQNYLGPRTDIDKVYDDLAQWKTIRNEVIQLLRAGDSDKARLSLMSDGISYIQASKTISDIETIKEFAKAKSDAFYTTAQQSRRDYIIKTVLLIIGVLLTLLIISILLRRNIIPPLKEITAVSDAIFHGRYEARVQYESANELGKLSRSFNIMAETIESEIELNAWKSDISLDMNNQTSLRNFCQDLLKNILHYTHSQIGAIYFIDEKNQTFEHYESIGLNIDKLSSFSAIGREGEFGTATSAMKIKHIKDIPYDTQIVFSTVSGDYMIKEIITIPIIKDNSVISMISIAGIKPYTPAAVKLINHIIFEVTARICNLLATEKVVEYSKQLQITNSVLQQQTNELEMQAAELSEQNAELEMQKMQLNEVNRLKTNFLSNMSHELRTPLNSVIALSGVLNRRLISKISDEDFSYLEIIERNGKNLLGLINDILDISRIESGREEIEYTKFNLNDLIADTVLMIKPQADQKKIGISFMKSNSDTLIVSDSDKLIHVLQNIIGNAVKFTEQGNVDVSMDLGDNQIKIFVKDSGIGIAKENMSHIFDKFRQAESGTSRRFGGSGLGLAIARQYTELLGGTIEVDSILGEGSEFTIVLPLSHLKESDLIEKITNIEYKANNYKPNCAVTLVNNDKTILLIEDNESAIIQIGDLLEVTGNTINVAHNAQEAFTSIEESIPDAIILDLMMPGIDGFEILRILREMDKTINIPVLILTAKHITQEELKFLKSNHIFQLVQKGDINHIELKNIVSAMLFPKNEEAMIHTQHRRPVTNKPLILVVEDNVDNIITVKAVISDGFEIIEARDGEEAIKATHDNLPDLILMDISLPGISGIDAFKSIRLNPESSHIPVIALTASALMHDRETILSHGFDLFIPKPINSDDLLNAIHEVLYGK